MKYTLLMEDSFEDQRSTAVDYDRNSTCVSKTFTAENIEDLVDEFTNFLIHCGYVYVDHLEIIKVENDYKIEMEEYDGSDS